MAMSAGFAWPRNLGALCYLTKYIHNLQQALGSDHTLEMKILLEFLSAIHHLADIGSVYPTFYDSPVASLGPGVAKYI